MAQSRVLHPKKMNPNRKKKHKPIKTTVLGHRITQRSTMKQLLLSITTILFPALLLTSCGDDVTQQTPETKPAESIIIEEESADTPVTIPEGLEYTVDTEASVVNFTGEKILGDPHIGGWSKWSGLVIIPENDFTKAYIKIEFDMTSTFSDDADLTKKLIGEEFFEVATYPTSTSSGVPI